MAKTAAKIAKLEDVSSYARLKGSHFATYRMTIPRGINSGGILLRLLILWVMVCAAVTQSIVQ
jgi:hypothetical protein